MSEKKAPILRFKGFTDEWEQRKLRKVVQINMGQSPKGETYTDNPSDYILVQGNADMKNGKVYPRLWTTQVTKTAEPGDIILSVRAPVGDVGKTDYNVVLGRGVAGIKGNEFIYQALARMKLDGFWTRYSTGSTFESINSNDLKDALVSFPSEQEQIRIGTFLKEFDENLVLHQRKLEKLKTLKKAYLQLMLPQADEKKPILRFSNFYTDWQQCKLGDNATIKGRLGWKSLKQGEYTDKGPSLIAGKHIKNGVIDWDIVDHIPDWRYDESPEIMLKNGDIIFSKDGSLGNPAMIKNLQVKATINSTMMLVRVNDTISPEFFYQVLQSNKFERLIYLKVSGSSIPHLFQADMNEFSFPATNREEQDNIGKTLKKLDQVITLQQNKLEKLKVLKKSYLQKMFI